MIRWKLRTGAPWRDVPEGCGPATATHERQGRLTADGTCERILDPNSAGDLRDEDVLPAELLLPVPGPQRGGLGRGVFYEPITPEEFRASLAPLLGEGPAAGVAASYQAMDALPGRVIDPERSAQKLLGLTPRTTGQWLNGINLQ